MKTLLIFVFLLFPVSALAYGDDVHVDGYTRSNGTYVQPHMRTAPDNTTSNNYSTYGNTNPYTGKQGTHHPDSSYSGNSFNHNSSANQLGGNNHGGFNNNSSQRGW